MYDYAHLTKSSRSFNTPAGRPGSSWRPADQAPEGTFSNYSPDFLKNYLLHFCRLCDKTNRQGTVPVLETLLDQEPENGEVHFMLARQYELLGRGDLAMPCFDRAAALCPERPKYALAAVRAAGSLGDRNKAMSLVNSVIDAYPTMAEAWYERSIIHEIDENWNRVIHDLDQCTRLEPFNTLYLCDLAQAYRRTKLYKLARRMVDRALQINPHDQRALEELRSLPLHTTFSGLFRNDSGEE